MTASASPLWTFSLAVYGADGVQDECLDLQERYGLDVNVLLFCAFVGAVDKVTLTTEDIAAARTLVGIWNADVVQSLRAARRSLKILAAGGDEAAKAAAQLRNTVKAAELEAERIEQMMLERWTKDLLASRPRADARSATAANVRALLEAYGAEREPNDAVRHLIAAALGAGTRATACEQ